MSVALEIAVQDPDGIATAARAGADRIELCTGLALGGLTPSRALVEAAVAGPLPVQVLVRPRPGGFEYSAAERAVLLADVRAALATGAAGVVVGATTGGGVDLALVKTVRGLADGAEVTFHRAFDTLADRHTAVEHLAALGVDRVLTSGGASRAPDGMEELARLVEWADGRLQIMAGGGIDSRSVARVAGAGVVAVHASAKRSVDEVLPIALGSQAAAGAVTRETTDEDEVRALRAALAALKGHR